MSDAYRDLLAAAAIADEATIRAVTAVLRGAALGGASGAATAEDQKPYYDLSRPKAALRADITDNGLKGWIKKHGARLAIKIDGEWRVASSKLDEIIAARAAWRCRRTG
jgi:hypothetical protein